MTWAEDTERKEGCKAVERGGKRVMKIIVIGRGIVNKDGEKKGVKKKGVKSW